MPAVLWRGRLLGVCARPSGGASCSAPPLWAPGGSPCLLQSAPRARTLPWAPGPEAAPSGPNPPASPACAGVSVLESPGSLAGVPSVSSGPQERCASPGNRHPGAGGGRGGPDPETAQGASAAVPGAHGGGRGGSGPPGVLVAFLGDLSSSVQPLGGPRGSSPSASLRLRPAPGLKADGPAPCLPELSRSPAAQAALPPTPAPLPAALLSAGPAFAHPGCGLCVCKARLHTGRRCPS